LPKIDQAWENGALGFLARYSLYTRLMAQFCGRLHALQSLSSRLVAFWRGAFYGIAFSRTTYTRSIIACTAQKAR
jgi:hypothetical protein